LDEIKIRHGNEKQLTWVSPFDRTLYEKADAMIFLRTSNNTRALSNVDTQKQGWHRKMQSELLKIRLDRSGEGKMKWVVTQFPTPALAQESDMSLREYEDFVYASMFCDKEDPVGEWRKVHQSQEKLVDWLKGKKKVTVKGPNIDMTLSIDGRTFINSDGKYNMPDGEIFTGPVEESVNGWVRFTYPAINEGREVEGVEFHFKEGKVEKATARKNEEFLLSQLNTDKGARYLGEFAIGTNYGIQHFTKSILYDEKIGGTLHMAVGASYAQTGGKNQSAIHWDFICDMRQDSEIHVDGELLYKNGQFAI
jgi:aminopeptidase